MEELLLDFDSDELEMLKKFRQKYRFPVVHIGEVQMCFNAFASAVVPQRIQWFSTGEYFIALPAKANDKGAFIVRTQRIWHECKVATVPIAMKEKKIKSGYYKVYKYKDGFAFNRYQPLDDGAESE